jgi:hypothetical protein
VRTDQARRRGVDRRDPSLVRASGNIHRKDTGMVSVAGHLLGLCIGSDMPNQVEVKGKRCESRR